MIILNKYQFDILRVKARVCYRNKWYDRCHVFVYEDGSLGIDGIFDTKIERWVSPDSEHVSCVVLDIATKTDSDELEQCSGVCVKPASRQD